MRACYFELLCTSVLRIISLNCRWEFLWLWTVICVSIYFLFQVWLHIGRVASLAVRRGTTAYSSFYILFIRNDKRPKHSTAILNHQGIFFIICIIYVMLFSCLLILILVFLCVLCSLLIYPQPSVPLPGLHQTSINCSSPLSVSWTLHLHSFCILYAILYFCGSICIPAYS